MTNLLNTTEAATRLGVDQSRIRQLILAGRLPATKIGRDWLIDEADLEQMPPRVRTGRPKSKAISVVE